jgi:BCD family chlorophyll transporter-like MFS transporter
VDANKRERIDIKLLWTKVGTSFLPFADSATKDMPLSRLLRLSLFQVSVGMAMALTVGTLNRVMIVELNVSAALVAVMVALPLVFAPFRALIGFKSDHHKSFLGWRRVPYIWFGTLIQFGGLAIMPFALMVLSGDNNAPVVVGQFGAALAFLMVGAGVQTTQTAGFALSTDLVPEEDRPRVVALMLVMALVGMFISGIVFFLLLIDFSPLRLIQVVQGAALLTMILNLIALWKQEPRTPQYDLKTKERDPDFKDELRTFLQISNAKRFLVAIALGSMAFSMQDVLLEPYGGEILNLSVAQTSLLTAVLGFSSLAAFGLSARALLRGFDPYRLAAYGLIVGVPGFTAIIFAAPLESGWLFRAGVGLIGFGLGLFSVATLTAAMSLDKKKRNGLALGVWGSVQATAAGVAIAIGGVMRDILTELSENQVLGPVLSTPTNTYGVVYHIEILLLFAALAALGPLVRHSPEAHTQGSKMQTAHHSV